MIGVGGGRDVLSQRLFGVSTVTGIEINPIIVDVLEHHFSDYTAIAVLDGVRFEVDEARSWFARTPRSFDVIQMSLIDIPGRRRLRPCRPRIAPCRTLRSKTTTPTILSPIS